MRKYFILLTIILSLILGASPSFSQNISQTEAKKYLDAHPELKKYAIPGSTPVPGKEDAFATDEEKPKGLTEVEEEREERAFTVKETEKAIILPVFGHRLFSDGPASFTPPSNMPVTADYIVGPDDNIIVQLWGRINEQYDLTVQRDGSIQFPQIGTIQVAGLTYKQLQDLIKREAESITGVNVSVSMGKLRSITVFVVGAAKKPGAYTVSAFDTLLNALIYAGGPEIMPPQKPYESQYSLGESSYVPVRDKEVPSVKEFVTRLKKEKELREKRQRYDKLDADQLEKEIKVLERIEKRQENIDQLKQILAEKKSAEESEKLRSMKVQEIEEEIRKIEGSKTPERQLLSEDSYVLIDRGKEKEILMSVLLGSMRNIQLKRRGKTVTTFDLYDLILKGDNSRDVRLEPGDIIFVPKPGAAVAICGDVRVPAVYELKQDRKLITVLNLAGGINPSAYSEQIQVQRYLENRERIVLDMSLDELKKEKRPFTLQDGDVVRIFPVIKEDTNAVYLFGNVTRPGKYEHSSGMRISDIIKAEDLKPETHFPYALIKRYNPPEMSAELVPFNLGAALLKHNMEENIRLQPGDEVHIFSKWTFEDKPYVSVTGEVRKPGKRPYEEGMCIKDAILAAGDLTKNAYLEKGEIVRVNKKKEFSTIYFNVGKVMADDPQENLLLQDQDRIIIHSIWEWVNKQQVYIEGDIKNPGDYQYTEQMTVKDLVFKAGNILESAYIDEAEITSLITEDRKTSKVEGKTINLGKALEGDPAHNVRLRPHDRLHVKRIPDWHETKYVSVSGEFRFPGRYVIKKGERLSSLIKRAGGFTGDAYLKGAFFTRESAKKVQEERIKGFIDRMEEDVLRSQARAAEGSLSEKEARGVEQSLVVKRELLAKLRAARATGRVVIHLDSLDEFRGSKYDLELEEGDTLAVPSTPGIVNVLGSVYNPTSIVYTRGKTVNFYLNKVGGSTPDAEEGEIYIIRADGTVISKTQKGTYGLSWDSEGKRWLAGGFMSARVDPGDTVLVPARVTRFVWKREIIDWTQIFYQIAVSAGVIIAAY